MSDAELVNETLRLYQRYELLLVEGLNLCPFARKAREDAAIAHHVSLQEGPDPEACLRWIEELEAAPQVEVGLFICPRLDIPRPQFEQLVGDIARLSAERRARLQTASFALAAFHPDAVPDMSRPERLIPYLRRTPDPTIQLVHIDALERVRRHDTEGTRFMDTSQVELSDWIKATRPSLRQRIAQTNVDTVHLLGLPELNARFADILRDRRETHARLRLPLSSWEHP